MSWFFGHIGRNSNDFQIKFNEKTGITANSFLEDDICLIYDDNKNCSHNLTSRAVDKYKFLISGTGISTGTRKNILCENDWRELLSDDELIFQLNGNFAGIVFSGHKINLFTDPIGLRDIYYIRLNHNEIIFSTRIDLMVKFVNAEINFRTFGGRWLLYNQVSNKSIFKNIERIVCGNTLTIDRKTYELAQKHINWHPQITKENYSESDFENELASLINVCSGSVDNKLLMLSGGLDSRVLLSLLKKRCLSPLSIYTFGNQEHPDIKVAKRITSFYGLSHSIVDYNKFYPVDFWRELKTYSAQTLINNSVTSFIHFRAYEAIKNLNGIVIDGGFGEIWRREFLYKLSIKGKDKIIAGDSKNIVQHLKLHRADIFNRDISEEMENGCIEQTDEIINILPLPKGIGVENWLDLFAIKTRLPNYYLHEQSCNDSKFTSFMPFIQRSLLSNLFNISLDMRKNGKLFRKIIRENDKALTSFPLVKRDVILPFNVTSFQSRVFSLLLSKAGGGKENTNMRLENLVRLKPLIKELLNNKSVKGSEIYNRKKLNEFERLIDKDIYDIKLWNEIDWWLAFESLRQSINLD